MLKKGARTASRDNSAEGTVDNAIDLSSTDYSNHTVESSLIDVSITEVL